MTEKTRAELASEIDQQGEDLGDIIFEALGGTPTGSDDDDEYEDEEGEDEDDDSQSDREVGEAEEGEDEPPEDEADEDAEPTEEEEVDEQPEDAEEAKEDLAEDGGPKTRSDKINKRIRDLVEQKKTAKADAEKYRAEAERYKREAEEAQSRAVRATPSIPEPDKKLAELRDQLAKAPTAIQVMESDMINPLTNAPYTPAEAQAAVVDYRQSLQLQIDQVKDAVVDNMTAARNAEQLFKNEVSPHLEKLITDYPELDKESEVFDQDLSDMLQAVINANCIMSNGLVSGFKKEPKAFVESFRRHMLKSTAVKVNNTRSVDKKVERRTKGAQALRSTQSSKESNSFEDSMLGGFEEAMESMER